MAGGNADGEQRPTRRRGDGQARRWKAVADIGFHQTTPVPGALGVDSRRLRDTTQSLGPRDRLTHQITLEPFATELAAVAALLDAAEGRDGIHDVALVDAERPGRARARRSPNPRSTSAVKTEPARP